MKERQAKNRYEHLDNGVTKIYLSNRPDTYTLIDTEDFEKIKEIRWYLWSDGYVYGHSYGRTIRLHRVILDVENQRGVIVDHVNRDKLDNRKVNLRIADQSVNAINSKMRRDNTSGFRGVYWNKQKQKFRAIAVINGIQIHLGLYNTPEEAYKAYLNFMICYHGFNALPDYLQADAIRFGIV
ncbi:MAG: hypothetical protein PWQ60_441 [Thermoanaerobacteraceae bacterium]|nr:hypothetical protein [Thermoanaerobacteraceae bacterium]